MPGEVYRTVRNKLLPHGDSPALCRGGPMGCCEVVVALQRVLGHEELERDEDETGSEKDGAPSAEHRGVRVRRIDDGAAQHRSEGHACARGQHARG